MFCAWGEILYPHPLTKEQMEDYEAKQYIDAYEEWREEPEKVNKSAYVTENSENVLNKESEITSGADKKSNVDISFYEAFDRFQAEHDVSENDEEIFYGSVFQEFNEQWQGKSQSVSGVCK